MPGAVKPEKARKDESRRGERFPLNMLTLAVLLTAAVLLMSLWSVYRLDRTSDRIAGSYEAKQKVIDDIEDLRQRAVLAVKRAVSGGEFSFWQNSYEKLMSELADVLGRAVELSGDGEALESARQLIKENVKLMELDRRAFSLVRQNEFSEARKLLTSREYLQSLQGYNQSGRVFESSIEDVIARQIGTFRRITFLIIIVGAFAFIIALAAWVIVAKNIRSWHLALLREREALRESQERYRLVNRATNDIIWDWNLKTDHLDWNEAVEDILGQSRDELSDTISSWYEHIDPEDRDRVTGSIHRAIDAGQSSWTEEYRFGPIGGPWRTYFDRGIIARDEAGKPYRMVGSMLDLTVRHDFEEALRASEAKFRSVFEQAALGIGRVRFHDATWIDVNDAFCEMLGYSQEELLSTPWPEITHPDDIEKDLIPFQRMAAGELDNYSVEKRFIDKEGHIVWARLTLSLVRDAEGEPDYEVAIIENITSRKETQWMLRRYELLARQSRDIILVVNRENGRIEEANEAAVNAYGWNREELLNMTVHDLRAPETRDLTADQMAIADGGGILFETRHLRKNGTSIPVEVNSQGAYIDGTHTLVSVIRDITERKQIEEQLRESESRFREAFGYAPVGMALTDLKGRFQQVNRAYCELTGYEEEELLTSGISFRDITHPEDLSGNIEEIERMLAGEVPAIYYEKRYVRKDEKIRWVLASVTLRRNENGKPYQLVAIVEDITDRKRAEQQLRDSEKKLATVIDSLPAGIIIAGANGGIERVNKAACEIWGIPPETKSWHDYDMWVGWRQETGERVKAEDWAMARALGGEETFGELIQNQKFGSDERRYFINNAVPLRDANGKIVGGLVAMTDVTERIAAEKSLEESRERLNAILEQLPLGVGLVDLEGHVTLSNAQMREFIDHIVPSHDPRQILQWKAFDAQGNDIPPDQWPVRRALRGEVVSPGVEFLYHRQSGEERWFSESAVPFSTDGRQQAILVMNEITQRKNSEKQREELLGSLQEKTNEMERFTSIIRHDFANPVISIQGFSEELVSTCKDAVSLIADQPVEESIKERIISLLDEDVNFAKSFIEDSVKQMNTMLDGLREVAVIGRAPVNIEPVEMGELIEDLAITMSTQLRNADAELTTGDMPDCRGDLAQLKQVFGNLVTNALKYKHPDRTPKIYISGEKKDGRCIYRVEDNGMGIESHNQPKIFDMFYRVDPSHPAPGDGMGLSIVGKILERHNGKIWVESEPGVGSTFFISLPERD